MRAAVNVPAWVKDAVFYQIFPDRFANGDPSNDPAGAERWGAPPKGNNFFGGDLQGIMDHTGHLQRLGVNALYLNPIFEATSNHKYNTKDYLRFDPSFGTNALFDRFSSHVREVGFRLVLDGVFNHVGTAFAPFEDVVKNGDRSPYASWFNIFSWPVKGPREPNYECWWGYGSLPKLMAQHPEVKEYLLSVAKQWTPKIDGWRLDVANEVPHEFWKEFRTAVRGWNPECYIVGELWEDASPWLQGDEFDATMNYRFRAACLEFFTKDAIDAAGFDAHLTSTRALYS
ncbi:MAG: glycoside hydrolase family 13 protein, partial [Bacteroidetes bacterium]|nr:glycoside hydrolase family 13 protein [Bacteroidota bacterium]